MSEVEVTSNSREYWEGFLKMLGWTGTSAVKRSSTLVPDYQRSPEITRGQCPGPISGSSQPPTNSSTRGTNSLWLTRRAPPLTHTLTATQKYIIKNIFFFLSAKVTQRKKEGFCKLTSVGERFREWINTTNNCNLKGLLFHYKQCVGKLLFLLLLIRIIRFPRENFKVYWKEYVWRDSVIPYRRYKFELKCSSHLATTCFSNI